MHTLRHTQRPPSLAALGLTALAALGPAPAARALTYSYVTLADPLTTSSTNAEGINDAGQAVGYYYDAAKQPHGFLYSSGSYTTLDDPLATQGTQAYGINDAGQIVGSYTDAAGTHGFLYSGGTFATLDDPLATSTTPRGINNLGQIVGSYSALGSSYSFLYSGGVFTTLPGAVNGINDAGQVVGSYTDAAGTHGFSYSVSSPKPSTTLDDPLATQGTQAFGINDAGQIVGTYVAPIFSYYTATFDFSYSGGAYQTLPDLPGSPNGINNNGQIVGFYYLGSPTAAQGYRGFLATPNAAVPEPSLRALLALGLVPVGLRARRRRQRA